MAAPVKPPTSWEDWKDLKDDLGPAPVKLWLEFTAAEEEPLPAAVDKRESEIYVFSEDNLTGNKTLDNTAKQLVKDYNTIDFNRRDIIRRMYRAGISDCKGLPKRIADDVYKLSVACSVVKKSYRELRRKGGRPVKFPRIFDERIKVPKK